MTDLLPPNATWLERAYAASGGRALSLDAPIDLVWDAWRCPAPLLPWLAWAMSVDLWDDGWPEGRKRQEIDDSPLYHRRKGTPWAIERLLDRVGAPYQITEWFQASPELRRGTGVVHIEAALEDIPAILPRIRPLVMAAKPKSRAIFVGAGPVVDAQIVVGAGVLEETLTIVDPYAYAGDDAAGAVVVGAGVLEETLTIVEAL